MSKVLVSESNLYDIADSIRAKLGTQREYTPGQMSEAIDQIGGGITPTGNINITDMQRTNVAAYATAQVVDADLVANNIKKDVNILGVVGSYEGSGGGGAVASWDLTESATDTLRGIPLTLYQVQISPGGVVFDSASDYIRVPNAFRALTIEVDVASMNLVSGTHRRFIMTSNTNGFIYRSTGKWSFYNGSWEDTNITDGGYFESSTVKAVVEQDGSWHIYKNGILIFEPTNKQQFSGDFFIGSAGGTSINDATITGLRIY